LKDDPHHADLNGFYSTDPKPISTSLRHIVCDNVDPAFRQLWFLTPGIEVVEMHMCKFKPWDDGTAFIFLVCSLILFVCRFPRNRCSSYAPAGSPFLRKGQALAG
jgi:hypothetical protein